MFREKYANFCGLVIFLIIGWSLGWGIYHLVALTHFVVQRLLVTITSVPQSTASWIAYVIIIVATLLPCLRDFPMCCVTCVFGGYWTGVFILGGILSLVSMVGFIFFMSCQRWGTAMGILYAGSICVGLVWFIFFPGFHGGRLPFCCSGDEDEDGQNAGLLGSASFERVFASFVEQCVRVGQELRKRGVVTDEDIVSMDPSVIIGLPAVVILRACSRSCGHKGLMLADGSEVDAQKLEVENSWIASILLGPFFRVKKQLEQLELSEEEKEYVELRVLLGDDAPPIPSVAFGAESIIATQARQHGQTEKERLDALKEVVGTVVSLAIDVTRLDVFKTRTNAVFERLAASGTSAEGVPLTQNSF